MVGNQYRPCVGEIKHQFRGTRGGAHNFCNGKLGIQPINESLFHPHRPGILRCFHRNGGGGPENCTLRQDLGAQLINAGFPGLGKVFQTRNRKGTESYGESGIFGGRYFLQGQAALEGPILYGLESGTQVEGLQVDAVFEGAGADGLETLGQPDFFQPEAVPEGFVIKAGDAFGKGQAADLAAPEGVIGDFGNPGPVKKPGNAYIFPVVAVVVIDPGFALGDGVVKTVMDPVAVFPELQFLSCLFGANNGQDQGQNQQNQSFGGICRGTEPVAEGALTGIAPAQTGNQSLDAGQKHLQRQRHPAEKHVLLYGGAPEVQGVVAVVHIGQPCTQQEAHCGAQLEGHGTPMGLPPLAVPVEEPEALPCLGILGA